MKKIAVIALFLALVFSVISCSNTGTPSGADSEGPYGKYDTAVNFTTIRHAFANPNAPEGMTMEDNPYADVLKEKLNVTYTVNWTAENYNEKLSMDIISGVLPDIFYVDDYLMYKQLVQNDMLEDLTDYYDQYLSDRLKEIYDSYGEDIFTPVTENGRLMALPGTNNGYQETLLWVRKDWLDMLGLQPPKTLDEIINVARAFIEQDPGGNGPGNTVGININREHCFDGYRNSFGLEPIGALYGVYPKAFLKDENGEIYYGSVDPQYKVVLSKVRDMITSGIIDIKSFDQGWEEIWGNVLTGKCGLFFFPWSYPYGNQAFIENNPRGELICYPAPLNDKGEFNYLSCAPTVDFMCVRKGYEHPEVLFKTINVTQDMMGGIDKDSYELLKPVRDAGTDWTYLIPTGRYACRLNNAVPEGGRKLRAYIDEGTVPDDITEGTLESWDLAKAWAGGDRENPLGWVTYTNTYMAAIQEDQPECHAVIPAFYYKTEGMLDVWAYLQSSEDAMVREILMGTQPIEYFDQFVQDWKDAGGLDILEEVKQITANNN